MLNHLDLLGTEGFLECGALGAKTGDLRQLLTLPQGPSWTVAVDPYASAPRQGLKLTGRSRRGCLLNWHHCGYPVSPWGSPGREGASPNSEVTGHDEMCPGLPMRAQESCSGREHYRTFHVCTSKSRSVQFMCAPALGPRINRRRGDEPITCQAVGCLFPCHCSLNPPRHP